MDKQFPIGKLNVPSVISMKDVEVAMDEIEEYVHQLNRVIEGVSDEDLGQTYREGAWNVRQLIHHITDSQVNMYVRLKMALTDSGVVIAEFDQNQWIEHVDNEMDVDFSIQALDGLNQRIATLGRALSDEDLEQYFMLNGEKVTVFEQLLKLSWHPRHHLAHIEIALDK